MAKEKEANVATRRKNGNRGNQKEKKIPHSCRSNENCKNAYRAKRKALKNA